MHERNVNEIKEIKRRERERERADLQVESERMIGQKVGSREKGEGRRGVGRV